MLKFVQNAERIATQRGAQGEANFSIADWAATRALEDRADPISLPRESASGFAASQEWTRMPDLAAGPISGTANPRSARALPSPDAHAATIPFKRRSPRARCRPISAGLAAKRHADQAPSRAARHLRAGREIKCGVAAVPRACHVAGAAALAAARGVTFSSVTGGVSRCNEP